MPQYPITQGLDETSVVFQAPLERHQFGTEKLLSYKEGLGE